MQSTVVRIPVDVLVKLKERAGSRPLGRMLAEDFLGEPDTDRLIELKFTALEEKFDAFKAELGERLGSIFGRQARMLEYHQKLLENILKTQGDLLKDVLPALKQELKNIDANFRQQHQANLEIDRRLILLEERADSGEKS